MLNLLRAEWMKAIWNYRLTGFLVWILPVGIGAFYALMLASGFASTRFAEGMLATGAGQWTEDALSVWNLVVTFPFNLIGRMLPLAFMAVVFANEYQSGMWKNLVPRASRPALILSKLAVLTALIMLSFILTSIVTIIGQGLGHGMLNQNYGPALTNATLWKFLGQYAQSAALALASLLILAGGAALAAILTRSVLGGLLIGFGLSVIDSLSLVFLLLLSTLFDKPDLINLYRFTPSYNLDNALSWFRSSAGYVLPMGNFTTPPGWLFSLVVLLVWMAGFIGLSLWVFQRQDLTA
jgi:ABC-type transport system involved in multi-copper enzyme maturation permease subunit